MDSDNISAPCFSLRVLYSSQPFCGGIRLPDKSFIRSVAVGVAGSVGTTAVAAGGAAAAVCLSRGGINCSDTSDDCEGSQCECNSSGGLLNEGSLGGFGVVGHWFEVLRRSYLLDLFTISISAGNQLL